MKELDRKIRILEREKILVNSSIKKLKAALENKEIHKKDYEAIKKIRTSKDKKRSYIEELDKKIANYRLKREIGALRHKHTQQVATISLIMVIIIGLGLIAQLSGITGFTILQGQETITIEIDQDYTENTTLGINITNITSIRATGWMIGSGKAYIYAEQDGERYLVAEIEPQTPEIPGITGMVIADIEEQPETNTTEEINITPEINETNTTTNKTQNITQPIQEPEEPPIIEPETNTTINDTENITENVTEEIITPITTEFNLKCVETCDIELDRVKLLIIPKDNTLHLTNITLTVPAINRPPEQITDIEDMTFYGAQVLDASTYFTDPDKDRLIYDTKTVEGIITETDGSNIKFRSVRAGTYQMYIYVTDGTALVQSNVFTIRIANINESIINVSTNRTTNISENESANITENIIQSYVEIGKPVKWTKTINSEEEMESISTKIPTDAYDVTVKKGNEIINEKAAIKIAEDIKTLDEHNIEKNIELLEEKKDATKSKSEKGIINEEIKKLKDEKNLITGQVTTQSSGKGLITKFFEWLFNLPTITGQVIGGETAEEPVEPQEEVIAPEETPIEPIEEEVEEPEINDTPELNETPETNTTVNETNTTPEINETSELNITINETNTTEESNITPEINITINETNITEPEENITPEINISLNETNTTTNVTKINATPEFNITLNETNTTTNTTQNITQPIQEPELPEINETINITENITEEINETLNATENITNNITTPTQPPEEEPEPIKLSEEEADLVITDNATNLTIEFTTPGPQLSETPIDEYTKKVTVSSKIHYTNIITYTNLPTEAEPSQIHIYWFNVTENCTTDNQTNTTNCTNNTIKQEIKELTYFDTNENGLIDVVQWITPYTSNQTFEISLTILNIQSYPIVGGYWTVMFNATGTANLTITPYNLTTFANQTTRNEEDNEDDLIFYQIECGENNSLNTSTYIKTDNNCQNGTLEGHNISCYTNNNWTYANYTQLMNTPDIEIDIEQIFIPDFNCSEIAYFTSKVRTPGAHHLRFLYNGVNGTAHNWAIKNATSVTTNVTVSIRKPNGSLTAITGQYMTLNATRGNTIKWHNTTWIYDYSRDCSDEGLYQLLVKLFSRGNAYEETSNGGDHSIKFWADTYNVTGVDYNATIKVHMKSTNTEAADGDANGGRLDFSSNCVIAAVGGDYDSYWTSDGEDTCTGDCGTYIEFYHLVNPGDTTDQTTVTIRCTNPDNATSILMYVNETCGLDFANATDAQGGFDDCAVPTSTDGFTYIGNDTVESLGGFDSMIYDIGILDRYGWGTVTTYNVTWDGNSGKDCNSSCAAADGNWNDASPNWGGTDGNSESGTWSGKCCGDDNNEFYNGSLFSTTMDSADANGTYNACCNLTTDCIYNGGCENNGSTRASVDGDSDTDYCLMGLWFDCEDATDCPIGFTCNASNDCSDSCTISTSTTLSADLNCTGRTLTITAAGTLTANTYDVDAANVSISGDVVMSSGSFNSSGNLTIYSGGSFTGGTGTHYLGALAIQSGGTFTESSGSTIINSENSDGYAVDHDGTVTANNGLLKITTGAVTNVDLIGSSGNFYNLEIATSNTDNIVTIDSACNLDNDFIITSGAIDIGAFHHDITGDFNKTGGRLITDSMDDELDIAGNFYCTGGDYVDTGGADIYVEKDLHAAGTSCYMDSAYLHLDGSSNSTINGSSNFWGAYLYIAKNAGYAALPITDIDFTHTIHTDGIFDINGKTVDAGGVYYGYSNAVLRMSSGTLEVSYNGYGGGTYSPWHITSGWDEEITGGTIRLYGAIHAQYGTAGFDAGSNFTPTGGTFEIIGTGNSEIRIFEETDFNFYNLVLNKTSAKVNSSNKTLRVDNQLIVEDGSWELWGDAEVNELIIKADKEANVTNSAILNLTKNITRSGTLNVLSGTARDVSLNGTVFTVKGTNTRIELAAGTMPLDANSLHNISKYVNLTDIGSANIALNVSYADSDLGNVNESNLRIYEYNGSAWVGAGTSNVDTTNNIVYATSITGFSVFAPLGGAGPTIPTQNSPANQSRTIGNSVVLNCSGSTDADNDTIYYVFYGDTSDGTTYLTNNTDGNYTWSTTDGNTYYWKCQASDGQYRSANTTVWQFTENTAPTHNAPDVTPDSPSTTSNLTCTPQSSNDDESDSVNQIYNWKKDAATIMPLIMPFDVNTSQRNGPTVAKDYSGNGNNGTISGATYVSGKSGGAYDFSSANIVVSDSASLEPSSISVEVWAKWDSISDQWLIEKHNSSDPIDYKHGFVLRSDTPTNTTLWMVGNGATYVSVTGGITIGTWHHIVGTYNGSLATLYVDGVEKANGTLAGGIDYTDVGDLYIGSSNANNRYFNGKMDEVRIYNRALTAEQVIANYNSGTPAYNQIIENETTSGENWTCVATPNDLFEAGTAKQDSVSIGDTAPSITLIAPANDTLLTSYTNRTPVFKWNSTDDDNDARNYTIYFSTASDFSSIFNTITNKNTSQTYLHPQKNLSDTEFEPDTTYWWRVQADDGTNVINSSIFNFTIQSYTSITLVNNTVEFGEMNLSDSNNTVDDNPIPFRIQNSGNTFANMTIQADDAFFNSVGLATNNFMFAAGNVTGKLGAFDWTNSQTTFANMPNSSNPANIIISLNYTDTFDEAEIDFNITVPSLGSGETWGSKQSTITLTTT